MSYEITEKNKELYRSLVLLDEMVMKENWFKVMPEDDDFRYLDNVFANMLSKDLIQIESDTMYVPTKKGKDLITQFYKKYYSYLRMFDIYCAVDLEGGSFGFSKYFEMEDDEFDAHLEEKQFSDIRIAVAEFKKNMDPIEIVFISFMNKNRFDLTAEGWQFDLTSDLLWDEIIEICNTAITADQLGKDSMEDIVEQGSQIMFDIIKQEKENEEEAAKEEAAKNEAANIEEEVVVDEYFIEVEIDEYEYYLEDPYYVSPYWYDPWYY